MREETGQGEGRQGLYSPAFEHDACGIGAVVDIKGRRSHATVDDALKIVEKLEHRAGKDAEGRTGDGVGILLQIPHRLFSALDLGFALPRERDYGVGMFFFPQDVQARRRAQKLFALVAAQEGLELLGWRAVPVEPAILGQRARDKMPCIRQAFLRRPEGVGQGLPFDRKLYVARRVFEHSCGDTYVASLSSRTVVYKGMFLVHELRRFYLDLQSELCESAIAIVHSRFSTNTDPSWERAHPNRLIAHNGEINTIRGNIDRMLAREETMSCRPLAGEMDKVLPVVNAAGSDSAMLDNTLEFLMMSGMELPLAVMVCIPEPWKGEGDLSRARRDLCRYYSILMEPWDGPASILFSDGDCVGAVLDRNGLRPSRYYLTDDERLILSSEVGVLDIPAEHIVQKSRLEPGKMLLVDTREGRVVEDGELKERYAGRFPFGEWLDGNLVTLRELSIPNHKAALCSREELPRLQRSFGYTEEDIQEVILPMARTGAEPTAAMGADTPLAALSRRERPLFDYFKQLFAQVTNPPMDALREAVVTDTTVYLADDGNLLEESAENCRVLEIRDPILTATDLMKIREMKRPGFHVETVSLLYYCNTPLKKALDDLFLAVDKAWRQGANIVILSDRGVDGNHVAIPSLLAVSAVEQYLIRTKKRTAISIVLESGEPRDVHHFAALLGYGARAVDPYLAHETIAALIDQGKLDKDYYAAVDDYNAAVLHGVVKIASKMGVSTLQSYQSAQIFEAVGISPGVVETYFTNTVSRVGGIGLEEIAAMVEHAHDRAFDPMGTAPDGGGEPLGAPAEDRLCSPQAVRLLRQAAQTGDGEAFQKFAAQVNDPQRPHTLRDLLELKYVPQPLPLEEVEGVESILRRFRTGAMSYGSISQEAHECMAQAMALTGAQANSGEGGEAAERFGTDRSCAVKQVASGRFGVTGEYLLSAEEIQIKMAQGAKPGEGGHLPGKKVYPWVARCRHATPGVPLISPPPHHDIYSIEDLAQLIYDLKNANRAARISVKLVSEAGVGTVAAGVAKAGAQGVLNSGYDGGTGAAPRASIYHAGLPWELGVSEAHQTLIRNGLRSRVQLAVDGKLLTGRDVAVACMLGAEIFDFATAPLIAVGCVMCRQCNRDTCPAGIATQDPALRRRFKGKPEHVANFMRLVAQQLREHMARLGVRTVEELVGRTDLLRFRPKGDGPRRAGLDLTALLCPPPEGAKTHFDPTDAYDLALEKTVDLAVVERALGRALERGERAEVALSLTSTDRAVGTAFGSDVTRRFGNTLPDDTFTLRCTGGAGQSFGAFLPKGVTLTLAGDANDYLGKGLSGGKIAVYPPEGSAFAAEENVIAGNVALYGATGGQVFLRGRAGERFCVRNSGADAVVEGVGDHGCEYMTGGRVVILGRTGKNFAAGMSGGVAYVWDPRKELYLHLNKTMVDMLPVTDSADAEELRELLEAHVAATGSGRGREILDRLGSELPNFKKIQSRAHAGMVRAIADLEAEGMSREEAELEAFERSIRA